MSIVPDTILSAPVAITYSDAHVGVGVGDAFALGGTVKIGNADMPRHTLVTSLLALFTIAGLSRAVAIRRTLAMQSLRRRQHFSSYFSPIGHRLASYATFALAVFHLDENTDGGGFEPPVPFGTHAFQACTINHSVTHPKQSCSLLVIVIMLESARSRS